MVQNDIFKDIVSNQIRRGLTSLSVLAIETVEDLITDGYNIPPDKFDRIRKKILDKNGYIQRELITLMDKVDILPKLPDNKEDEKTNI